LCKEINTGIGGAKKYSASCQSDFWQNVFNAELDYIVRHLRQVKDVRSVGCGPAVIEAGLAENNFNLTGMDISKEALNCAPDVVRTVTGSAEKMPFASESFDAVIYVASLQFIDDYERAIQETARVLRSEGRLLVMLLNPLSDFFKEKIRKPDSYIRQIKHKNPKAIEKTIAALFEIQSEYFLGIQRMDVFQSKNANTASLYILKGNKRK